MHAGDPYILAAMDGRELSLSHGPKGPPTTRDEPAAFFFVIFGLVYEALATSSAESNLTASTRPSTIIAALQALKCLVRPEYSGKAILESATFDEFISLCYRMAMTESASTQVHLVEMLAILVANQDKPPENSRNGK